MSSRNRKIKPIEAKLRKEITNLEDEILNLHEENSELRHIVDQHNDYIKTEVKEIREEVALIGSKISIASLTWLGKFIFK